MMTSESPKAQISDGKAALFANALRTTRSTLHARAAAAGPPAAGRVSHGSSLRFDFVDANAAFYFHDLVSQKRCALEFQIRRSLLHFLLKLAQQLRHIEIAASFADYRSSDFASAQNCVQTLLHRTSNGLRRNAVF